MYCLNIRCLITYPKLGRALLSYCRYSMPAWSHSSQVSTSFSITRFANHVQILYLVRIQIRVIESSPIGRDKLHAHTKQQLPSSKRPRLRFKSKTEETIEIYSTHTSTQQDHTPRHHTQWLTTTGHSCQGRSRAELPTPNSPRPRPATSKTRRWTASRKSSEQRAGSGNVAKHASNYTVCWVS